MNRVRLLLLLAAIVIPACGPAAGGGSGVQPSGPPAPIIVQVYPKGWTGAEMIEQADGMGLSPDVAFSANGVGFAAWSQQYTAVAGARLDLWANRYVPGVGWGTPVLLEHEDLGHAFIPHIAADPFGNAWVVWSQATVPSSSSPTNVWAARYDAAAGWQPAQLLETSSQSAAEPVVALDPAGNGLCIWSQFDPVTTKTSVWGSRYAFGGTWSAPELLENETGNAAYVNLGMDGSGNGIAQFAVHDGVRWNLWANRYAPGTGWLGAELIEHSDYALNQNARLAVSADGSAFVSWNAAVVNGYQYVSRYVPGTGWLPQDTIMERSDTYTYNGSIAADASGNAIVVWLQMYQSDPQIDLWAQRFVKGVGWEPAQRIEAYSAGSPDKPEIAMNASGNALVVWHMSDGHAPNIWSNRYVVGIGWDAAREIETQDLGWAVDARVAIDPQSNGLAVWRQDDGAHNNIWANRYE